MTMLRELILWSFKREYNDLPHRNRSLPLSLSASSFRSLSFISYICLYILCVCLCAFVFAFFSRSFLLFISASLSISCLKNSSRWKHLYILSDLKFAHNLYIIYLFIRSIWWKLTSGFYSIRTSSRQVSSSDFI